MNSLLSLHGLKPNEQTVLYYLLEHGSTLASIISTGTKLKRPNVYAILNTLQCRGLIKKEHREKATYFSALPVKQILQTLELQAEQEFYNKKQSWKQLENELNTASLNIHQDFGSFKIETIESLEGIYHWLGEAIVSGDYIGIFNPQALQKSHIPLVEQNLKKTNADKYNIREIVVSGPVADWYITKINNPNHHLKEIAADKKFFSDMIIGQGTVVILNYYQENQVGIKIKEPDFYQSMVTLFETLWEKL